MSAHRQFDDAIDRYVVANNEQYDRTIHIMRVRAIMEAGSEVLRGYGVSDTQVTDALTEAALWALQYFERTDAANAAIHCAPVRYSPVTFRLARALRDLGVVDDAVARVTEHDGAYPEDPGR